MKKNLLLIVLLTAFISTNTECFFERFGVKTGIALGVLIVTAKYTYPAAKAHAQESVQNCCDSLSQKLGFTKTWLAEKATSAKQGLSNVCVVKAVRSELKTERDAKHQQLTVFETAAAVCSGTWKASSQCGRSLLSRLAGFCSTEDFKIRSVIVV